MEDVSGSSKTHELQQGILQTSCATSIKEIEKDRDSKWSSRKNYLILNSSRNSNQEVFEAEVLESSVIDEGLLKKIL